MMITIAKADASVMVEIVSHSPRRLIEVKIGGSVRVDGHEVESGEMRILFYSIVSDLVEAIDVINPRDKDVISFHPTQQ